VGDKVYALDTSDQATLDKLSATAPPKPETLWLLFFCYHPRRGVGSPLTFMRYGFVIDQDRCIGCHACTVACKEENQVPVGVFRTWVKYVEKGKFPDTSRHFGVLRCNHCDTAPCIEICPTGTLYRRGDGIVDFDNRHCIGCKACMQACPYDALHIDPVTHTAAKCHYCAHRIEKALEPACVIVCPTRAIIPGDLDDSSSQISRIVAQQKVAVRKPEKGTDPKLFYLGVEGDLLAPTRLQQAGTYFSSDRWDENISVAETTPSDWSGLTRETYDVPHPMPWGWKIAAYLWTKSVSAGTIFVPATWLALAPFSLLFRVIAPTIALAMLVATLSLLVCDLRRPDRFFYLLTKPNLHSWLVRGSYVLIAYGISLAAWLFYGLREPIVPVVLRCITALLGAGSAGYSAFLFAQAKGRDLWQSPMFFWHLLVHAVIAGLATLIVASDISGQGRGLLRSLSGVLGIVLLISLVMNVAELSLPHVSRDVSLARQAMVRGRFRRGYWGLAIGLGLILPAVLTALVWVRAVSPAWSSMAALLALTGLWWFDIVWVKAGQVVPLS
jgi:Fe-S-cluster-containing dehydrogenase component/formate-dependent nitrite reductase membrane component NrfD